MFRFILPPSSFILSSSGQALVWTVLVLPLFVAILGLALDGGVVLAARREAQNQADAAARAGAMQLDVAAYRAQPGVLTLDAAAAEQAALEAAQPYAAAVSVSGDVVTVQVQTTVQTAFLRLVGITTVRVGATAQARPQAGIAATPLGP